MRPSILVLLALFATATAVSAQQARGVVTASVEIRESMGAALLASRSATADGPAADIQLRVNSGVSWQMVVRETEEARGGAATTAPATSAIPVTAPAPPKADAAPAASPTPLGVSGSLRPATRVAVELELARDDTPRAPLPLGVDRVVTITMIAY